MQRLIAVLLLALALPAAAQPPRQPDAAEIQLKLRKLSVLGSALFVAAHPDDENTALLAWLGNERLVRAAYLSVTRGDGGQNLIGEEQGELLGVIRTQELLAARRIDGAEQFFTRAVDFGYSKSPDETLQLWGKEKILADVVWAIRRLRPDVIITRFPTSGGGHGQHTASALLAEEAFVAAADPARFPEQLHTVEPWQAKRLLWNAFRLPAAEQAQLMSVDVGRYSALLGKSFTEIAGESRSMHKSQGFGSAERRGTLLNHFSVRAGDPAASDLFEGVDLTWNRVPGSGEIARLLAEAESSFDPDDPSKSVPLLVRALNEMRKLPGNFWVKQKMAETSDAIRACAGLWIEAIATEPNATPGGEATVRVTVLNRSSLPMTLEYVWLPYGHLDNPQAAELKPNEPLQQEVRVAIPPDATLSQPYWLRAPHDGRSFEVGEQHLIGLPENPASFPFRLLVRIGEDAVDFSIPAHFRWVDPVRGEQYRPFEIIPPVMVNFQGSVFVFPDAKAKKIRAVVKSGKNDVEGLVRLSLPPGWKGEPESVPFKIAKKAGEVPVVFTVTPAATEEEVVAGVETKLAGGEWLPALGLVTIDYPHIPVQTLLPNAGAKLVRANIAKTGQRIGYIAGSGDEAPNALRQIGYQVATLTDEEIESGDLARYDAIVLGVRAYNTRPRLGQQQKRLFDYVSNGGTLVTQYNTLDDDLPPALGPYPFKLSRDRVTVESAPVTFNDPDHPLLRTPNPISSRDFDKWVQERGLYFTSEWDPKYQTVLASNDPGETPKPGGLLYARHGKGVFIYTSYAFFRQLPAGVSGAYRLFANLVSAK